MTPTTPATPATYSLHRRLTSTLLLATTAVWLLVAAAGYLQALHELDELFDDQLSLFAGDLLHTTVDDDDPRPYRESSREEMHFTVWSTDADGQLLRVERSDGAPVPPPTHWNARSPFTDLDWQGQRWRSYTARDSEHGLIVRVLENPAARANQAGEYAVRLVLPLLIGLPLLAGVILLLIARALQPMDKLAAAIGQRAADDASPVTPATPVPVELNPMLQALDQLFGRVADAIDRERRFTADAGHELRTPLAAIRLHAQIAQRALRDATPATAVQAVSEVLAATDRATHLTEQLLLLARLSPEQGLTTHPCDLAEAVQQACADLASGVPDHSLQYDGPDHAVVVGQPALLYMLVRNLVDNAIRYTPSQAPISVTLTPNVSGGWLLAISDDGPGIPAARRAEACRRFARLERRSGDGCGLGLSIVARIAELHHARLELDDHHPGATPPGLTVRLYFPDASSAPSSVALA